MRLSIVIVTHNRRETLLRTLEKLQRNQDLPHGAMELLVVDNASTDGTAASVKQVWPDAVILTRTKNEGVSARNHAFDVARGQYVLLIDDDSYPVGDAVLRSMLHMDSSPRTAAVVGRVVLPDDRLEASAFPSVMINCAVCLRKAALDEVGGFPTEFFRQAEEYDLSFKLWNAGWSVERFEDVVYRHDKSPGNRAPAWIHRLDIRNNLILVHRYMPTKLRQRLARDWAQRYQALAQHAGHAAAAQGGLWEARLWALREALTGRRTLTPEAIESIFGYEAQAEAVHAWATQHQVRRVIVSDFCKSLYTTLRACRKAELEVIAIADNNPAYRGQKYDEIPVLDDAACRQLDHQGVVLANINPAQVDARMTQLKLWSGGAVLRLWHPKTLGIPAGNVPAAATLQNAPVTSAA